MDAVLLAILSAALFGAMTVLIRLGFARSSDVRLASLTMTAIASGVTLLAWLLAGSGGDTSAGALWPFALAGILAPGLSQLLFISAIAESGAARASVVVGMAPLVSVAIALTALAEPVETALLVGAVLIVLGGLALTTERIRPADFRVLGLLLAFLCTVLFSTRDNLVRWLSADTDVSPLAACSVSLLAGTVLMLAAVLARRERPSRARIARSARAFAAAGLLFGLSYAALFEAYYRGRVTVVSPLVSTESLWGVSLSALFLGATELVGRRLLVGAALVVAGGALIGAAS